MVRTRPVIAQTVTYILDSNQHLPRIMHAWERMHNFIIIKRICGFKG